jgi:hypothetical protein
VALAIVLVFGAAIVSRELVRVLNVPLGFEPQNILAVDISLLDPEGLDRRAVYVRALETLARRADVRSVGAAGVLPLSGAIGDELGWTSESKELGVFTGIVHVLPGYFETAGIRLVRGRLPDWNDARSGAEIGVVSESAARTLYGQGDPIGATFENRAGRQFTVVGVVADIGKLKPGERPEPYSYVIAGEATRRLTLLARARSRQDAMPAEIRREVSSLAPNTVVSVRWWEDSIAAVTEFRNPRFQTLVLGSFGTLALGLTGLGIFSVVSFVVASRTREMGVRLALGATPKALVRSMVRQSLTPVAAGLVFGFVGTQWLAPLAEAQFQGIDTHDPIALGLAATTVLAAAVAAAYLPARRAGGVDPMAVLREE